MKRLSSTVMLLWISSFSLGQNKLPAGGFTAIFCNYELTYFPDSTSKASKTDEFVFYFDQGQSLFKSRNRYLKDSAIAANGQYADSKALLSFLQSHPSDFNLSITKTGCETVQTTDLIYHDYYSYNEPSGYLKWALTSDKANVAGYACERATTEFGGRKWEAWFTRAVPVQDGPYKFCGLPGLIVRVTDSRHHYDFMLRDLRPLKNQLPAQHIERIPIDKSSFFGKRQEYRTNPIGVAEQSGVVFTSGRSEIAERVEQKMKSDNNPIEFAPMP